MKPTLRLVGLLILGALFCLSADGPIAVCDAIERSMELDGKVVRIAGAVERNDHFATLAGKECGRRLLFQYPDEIEPKPPQSLLRDEVFKVFSLAFSLMLSDRPTDTKLVVVLEGLFQTALRAGKRVRPGFGRWEQFDERIIVTKVRRVEFGSP